MLMNESPLDRCKSPCMPRCSSILQGVDHGVQVRRCLWQTQVPLTAPPGLARNGHDIEDSEMATIYSNLELVICYTIWGKHMTKMWVSPACSQPVRPVRINYLIGSNSMHQGQQLIMTIDQRIWMVTRLKRFKATNWGTRHKGRHHRSWRGLRPWPSEFPRSLRIRKPSDPWFWTWRCKIMHIDRGRENWFFWKQ